MVFPGSQNVAPQTQTFGCTTLFLPKTAGSGQSTIIRLLNKAR